MSTQVQVTARHLRTFLDKADNPTLIPAAKNLLRLARENKIELEEAMSELEEWIKEHQPADPRRRVS